jgi:hypothetical protein
VRTAELADVVEVVRDAVVDDVVTTTAADVGSVVLLGTDRGLVLDDLDREDHPPASSRPTTSGKKPMPVTKAELNDALAQAAITCANKAAELAEADDRPPVATETYASAAAKLALAAKGKPIAGIDDGRPD